MRISDWSSDVCSSDLSADLLNLVRHELGFSRTEKRFPAKATCLVIYSRCVNAEMPIADVLRASFPWCLDWAAVPRRLFAGYVEAKQAQNALEYEDQLPYWAPWVAAPAPGAGSGCRFAPQ